MAGIFVNVNDDIQNLRKLKNEINEVKKALKGINVTVDFDIKKDLEAQLKSLTTQYDALASKISETEGKIMLSTQRINDTTNKIIEAQNKLVAGVQGKGSQQQAITSNNAEVLSVQAQAKAYDELKADIDAVLGSRSENIKRMVEEQTAIRMINAELKQMEKVSGGSYSPAQLRRIEQLNNSLFTHKAALAEVRQALNNNAKIDNAAANSMSRLSQELGRMRMAYRELTIEEQKSPFGQELLASINQVDAKMKEMDASIGNYQRNVGNYGTSFNGLNVSVQQIVRELPAASMGLNTFFLAISNNIPILTDEIKRAKIANEELKKSGQTGVPVWKQVATSLFSWQTAMMVGISLLTIYGKDLGKWIQSLFKGKDAVDAVTAAENAFNESMEKGLKDSSKEISNLDLLYNASQDTNRSLKERNAAIDELQRKYPNYFGNLDNEAILAGKAATAYDKLKNSIIAEAQAQAIRDKVTEIAAKRLESQINADKQKATQDKYAEESNYGKATVGRKWVDSQGKVHEISDMTAAAGAYNMATLALNKYNKEIEEYDIQISELTKHLNVEDLLPNDGGLSPTTIKSTEDLFKQVLALKQKNQQDEINLMEEGNEKVIKQIKKDYEDRIDVISELEKKLLEAGGGKMSEEDSKAISKAYDLAEQKKEQDLYKAQYQNLLEQYKGYFEQRKTIEDKYDKDREGLIAAGASQESLDENAYQKDKALQEIDMIFASREEEFQIWAANVTDLSIEQLISLIEQAEQEIGRMEASDPKNPSLAVNRGKLSTMRNALVDARKKQSKGEDENPDPKAEKNWKELYNTLRKVERQFDEIGDTIGGTVGDIIGAAGTIASNTISIIDGITTLTEHSAKSMEGTTEAAGESMKAVEKASVILAIISAALQIATKIANMFGADYSNYNKAKENYESYVEVLDNVIGKQKELIETMTGKAAVEASEKALELIEKQKDAAIELGKMRLNAGASAGSHSIGVRQKKNISEQGWDEALDALGTSYYKRIREGRMEGLFDLSVEQLEKLQSEAPTFWAQLDKDVRSYLEQIIESNEAVEQMKETLQESLTGLTFDDFSSDILESLYDLEKNADEIFDDMSDYMRKSMIKAMYVKNYEPEMKKWYEQWSKAMEDGVMTTQEKESLDALKQSIINGAVSSAEQINDMFESTSKYTQEASKRGFGTEMTHEDAGELSGRFSALQISGEVIKNEVTLMNATVKDIVKLKVESNEMFSGVQDQLAIMTLHLSDINDNTNETVKCLKVIQTDIAEVKENTKNL